MPRYKLIVEYDGTPFSGWQIQDNALTVQGALETAVKAICGEDVRVHGAGRTDAGVHALAQVAHCDIARHFVPGRFRDGLNAHLRPHPIGVLSAEIVPDTFEARFSATKRHYLYRIANTRANLALDIHRVWRVPRRLDADAMHAAAQRLLGKHDFTTFRDTECQAKSPEKTLDQLDVTRQGDAINIVTSARSFLHSQVRSMVGSLVWVGEGRWSADDLAAALAARNRAACGPVAPPEGLYLVRVDYRFSPSWPGLSRPSTSFTIPYVRWLRLHSGKRAQTWMAGTSPAMTWSKRGEGEDTSGEIPLQYPAIDLGQPLQIGDSGAFVDLVHGLADQAELDHRAVARDEACI